nr:hypothetical protein [uncultured Pedobacter sp.]
MSYSSLNIEIENWDSFINQQGDANIFGRSDFLINIAAIYGFTIDIRVILFNGSPVLALPLFVNKKKVVVPNHYFYQYVWEKEAFKESWSQIEAWIFLLKALKASYNEIKLRLPINIRDVRPFIWCDFDINVRHTYEKHLTDLVFKRNLQRILLKQLDDFSFKKNCDWQSSWDFHYRDLEKLGIRKSLINSYISYLEALKHINKLELFNAYHHDVFVTSIIVIVDYKSKYAYFVLMGSVDKAFYKAGLPTLLYNYALNQLKENNFLKVDFLGANMLNISKYKSKFSPNLEQYHEVFYSVSVDRRRKVFFKLKSLLKKVLFLTGR